MSAVLLKNQLANGRLQVRIAWGANLAADPATWSWTDVTADVLMAGNSGISISVGRANEQSVAQPATCSLRLKNQTGAYTPANPAATNYPNVRLGTPVQVRVSLDGGSTWTVRFQGEAASWAPGWDAQGKFAYVALAASGITRRLGQGSKPVHSALYRAVTKAATLPTAYWPCEDGADGLALTTAASPITGVSAMVAVGASNFASTDGAPGSGVQPDFTAGGSLIGAVPGSGSVTQWRVQCAWKANAIGGGGAFAVPLQWVTADGHAWELDLNAGALVFSEDLAFTSPSAAASVDDGLWHEGRVTAVQNGGNIDIKVYFDGVQVIAESIAGTVSRVIEVQANSAASVSTILAGIGQFMVWNGTISISGLDTVDSMRGHPGETATTRLGRLCTEEGISLTVTGTSDTAMGPQGVDTILNLLRECEAADLGYLFDGLGPGLNYVARSWLYNEPVAMTIDANSGQVPAAGPQPALDDQRLKNRVTATRVNGSTGVTAEDTNGPLGTAALGVFDNRLVLNVAADSQLNDIATFVIGHGTVEGMRYPQIPLDLAAAPELASTWLAVTPTERVDVTNLSSRLTQHPAGSVSLVAEGWTEFLSATAWRVTINCSAFRPWEVFTIQDTRLGRIETTGSTLNSSATTTATSLSVASSGGVWDTASTPWDADIEGEQVTVTAVSGSSSPQTFTVTRSVNGVVKAHNSGAVVKLWKPGVLAL